MRIYGIVYSQSHRFARRCSLRDPFTHVVVSLIAYLVKGKEYSLALRLQRFRRFCKKHLGIFNKHRIRQLTDPVETAITNLGLT